MIVCATPRSGATILAMELAKERNAFFANEMTPNFLDWIVEARGNIKEKYHELHYQPSFTKEQYVDMINNPRSEKYVMLVNGSNIHWAFRDAEMFVARRNLKQWMNSIVNFWLKAHTISSDLHPSYFEAAIRVHVDTAASMYMYCDQMGKDISFYEDSEYFRETEYTFLDAFPKRQHLNHMIEKYINQTKIVDLYPGLQYN